MSMVAYLLAKGRTAIPRQNRPRRSRILLLQQPAHPQEPVEPLRTLISAFTRPGQVVLGPFCGSDSTLSAAREPECRLIGIDIDAMHCQTAAIVCRLPRVASQQGPDPAAGIQQLHASPVHGELKNWPECGVLGGFCNTF
jgi:site-specific DNA-methyltransferase (adenine-specific)